MSHSVCASILPLLLRTIKLEQVAELIALALVDQTLAINFCKLIIMPEYFDFLGDKVFISIVVTLHNQPFNAPEVLTSGTRRILAHLGKDEIVVTIGENAWHSYALLDGNLIVVAIDRQALHSVLLSDLKPRVMVIQGEVHVGHWRRMVVLLRRARLALVLRHALASLILLLAH